MLIGFLIASALCLLLVRRSRVPAHLPLAVFCLAYGITTVIGATIISVQQGGDLWALYGGGLDTTILSDYSSFKYLFLLYSPCIVCPLVIWLSSHGAGNRLPRMLRLLEYQVDRISFAIVSVFMMGYCLALLLAKGYLKLTNLAQASGDYYASIGLRSEIFSSLGTVFFGLLYMGLPTLAHFALHKAVTTRTWFWRFCFLGLVLTVSLLTLLTIQKAPLFVFFLSLAIGYVVLKRGRLWVLLVSCAVGFLALNSIQLFVLGDWSALQGFYLIVFRMANGFPYYVNAYPRIVPHPGPDFALDLLGLAPKPNTTATVFNLMYPEVLYVQGNAPAPAHVDAYAQAGIWFSMMTLVIIGIYLYLVALLKTKVHDTLGYVFYIEGIVLAYYLTQVTIRDCLLTGYGLVWIAAPIVFLMVVDKCIKLGIGNVRLRCDRLTAIWRPSENIPVGRE